MEQVIVAQSVGYLAKRGGGTISVASDVGLLDTGAIALVDSHGVLIPATATNTALANAKGFKVFCGTANPGNFKVTGIIKKDAPIQTKSLYHAPAIQVITIGNVATGVGSFGFPSVFIDGQTLDFSIYSKTPSYLIHTIPRRYAVVTYATDTSNKILDRLIAMINANTNSDMTAAAIVLGGVTTGITLTAKDNRVYGVGVSGISTSASVYTDGTNGSVLFNSGRNTSTQVALEEQEGFLVQGDSFRYYAHNFWFKEQSLVVAGTTYTGWTFQQSQELVDPLNVQNVGVAIFKVFVPTGSAIETALVTLFGNLFLGESSQEGTIDTINLTA